MSSATDAEKEIGRLTLALTEAEKKAERDYMRFVEADREEIERLRAELAAERERVIEECAKVSESGMLPFSLGGDHILCPATAMTIAENIRALKGRRG